MQQDSHNNMKDYLVALEAGILDAGALAPVPLPFGAAILARKAFSLHRGMCREAAASENLRPQCGQGVR